MKKTITSLGIVAMLTGISTVKAQSNFVWANQQGGSLDESANSISVDASGNVYTTGYFNGTVDFDPSSNNFDLTSVGAEDIYISKFDAAGNFIWAKSIGSTGSDKGNSIKVNAAGDVYVTGNYAATTDFDPGVGTFNLTAASFKNTFVTKFNTLGDFLWAKTVEGGFGSEGTSISLDSFGNVLNTGNHRGTTDFDMSALTYTFNSGAQPATYITKYNLLGGLMWAYSFPGTTGQTTGKSISLDGSDNVYILGFDGASSFIRKNDASGVFLGITSLNGTFGTNYNALTTDASGNIYVTGSFMGTVDFDPGTGVSNLTASSTSAFICKLDASMNFVWAKSVGATSGITTGKGISVDALGGVYITGSFENMVDFNPGAGVANLTSAGAADIFILKLNALGNYEWAKAMGGSVGPESGNAITTDDVNNVLTAGQFENTVDFDPSANTFDLSAIGGMDIFIHKMCQLPSAPVAITSPTLICNATSSSFSVSPVAFATSYSWTLPNTWTGTSTTNMINAISGATGIFSVTATNACGSSATKTLNVVVSPASINVGPNLNLLCKQKSLINAVCSPTSPVSVVWTPATNLSSSTVLTPSVTGSGVNTQYSVTVNLSNGCVVTSTLNVSATTQTPSICMVTVDSIGKDNVILWNKANYPEADSFYVYRDIANGNYQIIGKVPSTSTFGEFRDTVRTLYSANGDPNVSSWRYKIAYKDSCGNMSALSNFHKTLFMQNSTGNFSWNDYQIEGQPIPVPILTNYIFRRDNLGNGNWQNIQTLGASSTAYTDPNYSSFIATANWRAETVWTISCGTSYILKSSAPLITASKSKSNVKNNLNIPTSINKGIIDAKVVMYPNPVNDILNIELTDISGTSVIIIENALGQVVYTTNTNNTKISVDVSKFAKGFYNLKVQTNQGNTNKKIIID